MFLNNINFIKEMVEQLGRAVIAKNAARTIVQLICDAQDIVVAVQLDRGSLRDVVALQTVVTLVLRALS